MGQRQAMQAWRVLLLAAALLFQPLLAARSGTGTRMHDLRATIPKPGSAKLMPGAVGVSAVRMEDGSFKIVALGHEDALAEAVFIDGDLTASNMGHLEVWTWPRASDLQQLNAAGHIEGWATAERIAQHFYNMWTVENVTDPEVMRWFRTQHDWVRGQLDDPATQDEPYWHAMRLTMQQFDGMIKGYNDRALTLNADPGRVAAGVAPLPALSVDQFYFLCSLGDLSDVEDAIAHRRQQEQAARGARDGKQAGAGVEAAVGVVGRTDWSGMSPQEVQMELAVSDRCSALVKVSPDFREIWVSQAAWYTYASMLRVFKHYDFAISDPSILGRSMGFSSYYGQLTSEDDFYLVGSGLAVLQTTNRIFDQALLDRIQPEGVLLCWQRVRVACAVAPDGPSWARAIQAYNSGTYTNSWMVVDLGAFEPGKALPQWMLTVVEQVPGNVWWEDRTQQLESGYMALFNVPVLPQTYAALGYPQFVQQMVSRGHKYGEAVSGALWQVAPRAKQFRRDHAAVTDMDSMQLLMRSNNWQTDPYSMNVSTNAICGRADVNPDTPAARGCYDGKVSNLRMALALEAQVINGPPHNQHMQPFTWAGSPWEQLVPHVGQPSRFEFEWEIMRPSHTAASRQAASVQPA